jgi:hypothetical protein
LKHFKENGKRGTATLPVQSPLGDPELLRLDKRLARGNPQGIRAGTVRIIGDWNRGDSPESSDGLVDYSSSNLHSAKSELTVPTGPDVEVDPIAGVESKASLLQHLAGPERPNLIGSLTNPL